MSKILVTRSSMPPMEEYMEEIKSIWDSHWLTNMGEKHEKLTEQLEEYLGVEQVSLFSNGHMALELGLQAMNISGGEVITTPFTFASTTHAIVRNGMKPVFCDIREDDYTMDVSKIESLITDKTVAIVPVHVYGNICDVEGIERLAKKYGLKVFYDAAHAFGETYKGRGVGSFGDASMFSFHATKVYNTIEGGAVCFSDPEFGRKLYRLKNFGIRNAETVDAIGANAKMNEFQAAMGICNLRHIDEEITKRKTVYFRYRENLNDVKGIHMPELNPDVKYNYAYFPIVVNPELAGFSRDDVFNELMKENIYSRKYFYPITNAFDCYKDRFCSGDTPIALDISNKVLTLPMYADLTIDSVDKICSIINRLA